MTFWFITLLAQASLYTLIVWAVARNEANMMPRLIVLVMGGALIASEFVMLALGSSIGIFALIPAFAIQVFALVRWIYLAPSQATACVAIQWGTVMAFGWLLG